MPPSCEHVKLSTTMAGGNGTALVSVSDAVLCKVVFPNEMFLCTLGRLGMMKAQDWENVKKITIRDKYDIAKVIDILVLFHSPFVN